MAKVWKKLQRADGDFTGTIDGTSAGDVKTGAVAGTAAKTITDAAFDGDTKLKTANAQAGMINSNTTATDVGLGNVTNESKADMFASPTFTGTVAGVSKAAVGLANVANESPSTLKTTMSLNNVTNESKSTMFASPTFTGSITGVDKDDVGLGNVDNNSTATILGGTLTGAVANSATVGGTAASTVASGAASGATVISAFDTSGSDPIIKVANAPATLKNSEVDAAHVGLGNVTNESKSTMFSSPTFSGTVAGVSATHVGLGNVTNESKSDMFASPTFTGTVAGVSKSHVGLGSVVNQAVTVAGGKIKLDGTAQTIDAETVGGDSKDTIKSAAVSTAETNIIGSAPGTLNTLDELAAALNDDASFNSTITTSIATKAVKPVTISDPTSTPSEDVGVQGIHNDELYVVQDV
tara:strand:+ start:11339 stop:12568 length:1230 start_codon:yes stop_codon:yes gene_type:complete